VLISIPSEIEKAGGKPFIMVDQASDHRQYVFRASQVGLVVNSLPTNGADLREAGSIPGSGRSHLFFALRIFSHPYPAHGSPA